MAQNAKENLITQPPARSLFFFALPMIIGNLFQQFYNMADSIIVGNLVGEDALAAVGASYSFTTVFYHDCDRGRHWRVCAGKPVPWRGTL